VLEADILVLCGPIWLGDNSSVTKRVIERLYGCSSMLNEDGQYAYYGRVGGCLLTGNEDGVKHCAMNVLYSLQHLGYTIPPQADAGWIGSIGPGPSYLDPESGGPDNDFTNRNTSFMTFNLMHLAAMLKRNAGVPAFGNQRTEWDAGCRPDLENRSTDEATDRGGAGAPAGQRLRVGRSVVARISAAFSSTSSRRRPRRALSGEAVTPWAATLKRTVTVMVSTIGSIPPSSVSSSNTT